MNANIDPIQTFLLDVYGYGKLKQYNAAKTKTPDVSPKGFLDSTIIGTYRTTALNTTGVTGELFSQVEWPRVSSIKRTTELKKVFRKDLPHHIYNRSFFSGMDYQDVRSFLVEKILPVFTKEVAFAVKQTNEYTWHEQVLAPSFALNVQVTRKNASKYLCVDFDAPTALYNQIQGTVAFHYKNHANPAQK